MTEKEFSVKILERTETEEEVVDCVLVEPFEVGAYYLDNTFAGITGEF